MSEDRHPSMQHSSNNNDTNSNKKSTFVALYKLYKNFMIQNKKMNFQFILFEIKKMI